MNILGYTISPTLPVFPVREKTIISTINPHSYCVAKKDAAFQQALIESDFLLPDGIGIVYAAKILNGENILKIAGYDLFLHLMTELNESKGSCFFLGSSEKTLDLIKEKAAREFPDVTVNNFSPPYKPVFSIAENEEMCEAVNKKQPDVLFVGMTAPKQEKWVHQFKEELDAKIICSIGAVFDFYAGTVQRPSQFWVNLGLEWLPRFLNEPRRLAKRNLISTPKFLFSVFKEKIYRDQ